MWQIFTVVHIPAKKHVPSLTWKPGCVEVDPGGTEWSLTPPAIHRSWLKKITLFNFLFCPISVAGWRNWWHLKAILSYFLIIVSAALVYVKLGNLFISVTMPWHFQQPPLQELVDAVNQGNWSLSIKLECFVIVA